MCGSANRLANLAFTKGLFHLLCQEVHTPNMRRRGDILFQIILSNLYGAVLYSEQLNVMRSYSQ